MSDGSEAAVTVTVAPGHGVALDESRRRWLVLAVGSFAQAASAAINIGIATLVPAIRAQFGLSLAETGIAFAAVNLGVTVGLLTWGVLVDRLGERWAIGVGMSGAGASLVGAAITNSFATFLAFLVLTGIFGGSVIPATGRTIMRWFAPKERGFAVGLRQASMPLGGVVTAAVLPALVAAWNLRGGLIALAVVALISAIIGVRWLGGTGASTEGGKAHAQSQSLAIRPFRDTRIWKLAWASCLHSTSQSVVTGFVVLYLHSHRHLSLPAAAAVLSVIELAGAVFTIAVGRYSDRVARRVRPLRYLSVLMAGALVLVGISTHGSVTLSIGALLAAGFVSAGSGGLFFAATAEVAGPQRTGAALGLQQTVLGIAATLTPIAFAPLVAVTSWSVGFAVAAVFPAAALFLLRGSVRDL